LRIFDLSPPDIGERPWRVDRLLRGAIVPGFGPVDVGIVGSDIVAVEPAGQGAWIAAEEHTLTGRWIVPAFIDSHVHLSYLNQAEELAAGGIAAAVDHAAPMGFFRSDFAPLVVRGSGPMVTAVGGYPTQSWGANGYGLECVDVAAAVSAVNTLADAGAALIKVPLGHGPEFTPDILKAIVSAAHARSLPVSVHALTDAQALLAGSVGADVLAHAPVEVLSADTVAAWADRSVITTVAAFGAGGTAVANLAALHAAGARILYGTDFGNTTWTGVHPVELTAMQEAGMTPAEILSAGTSAPALFWDFPRHGSIAPGHAASLMILDGDPLLEPLVLAAPVAVLNEGLLVAGALDGERATGQSRGR
jgi:imidazolonepropionase-like amidohydrolase